ncbi:MAG: biopolymer transporter ExbD [Bdellovibrio sp.]|nr:biopolymer transporter ExbD [Bdellovibrio sp.]
MRALRKKMAVPKLNLVPIMDSVFIFIFFLLLSAQFVDIHEIQGDAPVVATFEDSKHKKEPLNLVLEIANDSINVKIGLDGRSYKKVTLENDHQLIELHKILSELKASNIDEDSVILKPARNLPYGKLVVIMDSIRSVAKEMGEITGTNTKGEIIKTRALFPQIIFETVM